MDDGFSGALELVVYGGSLLLALVNCAKGKFWFGLLFLPPFLLVVLVGAVRLAKPNSVWAHRFYSRETMERAVERFPGQAEGVVLDREARPRPPLAPWLGGLAIAIAAAISAQQAV